MPRPAPHNLTVVSEANLDRVMCPMMSRTDLFEQRSTRWPLFTLGKVGALVLLLVLATCQKEEKAAATSIRPVRTVTVNGKILERPVDIGTEVKKDDLLAVRPRRPDLPHLRAKLQSGAPTSHIERA
jgi:hypothetical protein